MLSEKRDELLEEERKSTEEPDDPRSRTEILLSIERMLKSLSIGDPNEIEPDASTDYREVSGPQD